MTTWLYGFLALACTASGITLLYRSWSWAALKQGRERTRSSSAHRRGRPQRSQLTVAAGWILFAVAGVWWIAAQGWEFGTIYAIMVPSLAAGGLLWLVADRRPGRVHVTHRKPVARPSWSTMRANLLTFLLAVPFGVVASTLATSATGLLLPFGELDQLVFIVCVMPVVWGLVAVWLIMDTRRLRPIVSLVALSGLSLATILVR